jgi:hypothetical protein
MDFVTVSESLNLAEAELAKSRLEANGFFVNLKDENCAFVFGAASTVGRVQVQVPEDQAESARALLQSQDPPSA